jgi:hypothetical protein
MTMVIITYNLAEGVTRERYREWSRTVDQVVGGSQPGITRYEVFEVDGAGVGEADCDIVEVIEADSVEAWEAVNGYEAMKPVYEEWLTIADPQSVKLLYASVV